MSHQKKYTQKVKHRKQKSENNDIVKESPKDYSTSSVQKYQQTKKESQLKLKVPFLRKAPKRKNQCHQNNKIYKTLQSPRTKAKMVSQIIETAKSSPCTRHLLEYSNENSDTEEFQNSKSYKQL